MTDHDSDVDFMFVQAACGMFRPVGDGTREYDTGDLPDRDGDGFSLFVSPHGSYRFRRRVRFHNGHTLVVAALQIVSRDGINGQIAQVYTLHALRRHGYARELLAHARTRFQTILHSKDLSAAGRLWAIAVDGPNFKQVLS